MGRLRLDDYAELPKGVYFNKNAKCYYFKNIEGKMVRLGKTLAEALSTFYSMEGVYFDTASFRDVATRYMLEISPTKKPDTHRSNIGRSKKLLKAFGDFNINEITLRHVRQYKDACRHHPTDANRRLSLLSSIFEAAIDWGLTEQNPCKEVRRFREKPRDRDVSTAELEKFKQHCPQWLINYIDLKTAIGARQKDMIAFKSSQWIRGKGLELDPSKTEGKSYHRTLWIVETPELREILERIEREAHSKYPPGRNEDWVFFPSRNGKPYTSSGFESNWQKVMKKATAANSFLRFTEHDLRAVAANRCSNLADATALLGHTNPATTNRVYRRGRETVTPVVR